MWLIWFYLHIKVFFYANHLAGSIGIDWDKCLSVREKRTAQYNQMKINEKKDEIMAKVKRIYAHGPYTPPIGRWGFREHFGRTEPRLLKLYLSKNWSKTDVAHVDSLRPNAYLYRNNNWCFSTVFLLTVRATFEAIGKEENCQ